MCSADELRVRGGVCLSVWVWVCVWVGMSVCGSMLGSDWLSAVVGLTYYL